MDYLSKIIPIISIFIVILSTVLVVCICMQSSYIKRLQQTQIAELIEKDFVIKDLEDNNNKIVQENKTTEKELQTCNEEKAELAKKK